MEPPPAQLERLPWRRSTLLTALLGLVLPGLGQLYVGRPLKALLFLVAILPTFLVGWALTDFTIVNPSKYGLDFAAQVFLGAPVLSAMSMTAERALEHMPRFLDVGRLYVQVAGLLNLVAISDALGEAIAHNLRVLDLRAARRERADTEARQRAEVRRQDEAPAPVEPSPQDEAPPPLEPSPRAEAPPPVEPSPRAEAPPPVEPSPPDEIPERLDRDAELEEERLAEEARRWPVFGPHPVRDREERLAPDAEPKKQTPRDVAPEGEDA